MSDLKVTLIQSKLHWHQPQANLAMFEEKIWSLEEDTDLIVLPEMFTTGFSMEAPAHAEAMGTHTFRWMQQIAKQTSAAITGSYMVKDQGAYFNRLIWMDPSGDYQYYDKRHLFRMAQEHKTYQAGQKVLVVDYKGWKICPQICYDLRFPVWNRNRYQGSSDSLDYDLLLFVANWPKARINAWDTLLQARAIENLCYVVGLNRVGADGVGIDYNGHSGVIEPKGHFLTHFDQEETISTQQLSKAPLEALRQKFPAYLDMDQFTIDQ